MPEVPAEESASGGVRQTTPRTTPRAELRAALELLAMCGFVVVQPLLETIGGSPGFLLFHGVTGREILLLVAVFTLVPPVALWVVGVLSALAGPRVRQRVHLVTVGFLLALFMIQIGKYVTSVRGLLLAVLAVLAAGVVLVGYLRWDPFRQLLRFAAIGPLVFVLLFTFTSPAAAVWRSGGAPGPGGAPGSSGAPVPGGGSPEVVGPHPPIVVLLFDELPLVSLLDSNAGVDAERFPHFAQLAGQSTWYRNATTVAGWTPHALPAMLTGQWPERDVAAHHSEYPENLFTLLDGVYEVEAIETISQLCPPWQCGQRAHRAHGGWPTAFAETSALLAEIVSPREPERHVTDGFAEPVVTELGPRFMFREARAENRPARFVDFLQWLEPATVAGTERPTLHFLHLLLPHSPWVHLPSGTRYDAPHLPLDGPWWPQLAHQRHLAQLEYTDRLLGEAVAAMQRAGIYDDAVVVVTSDHGHSFTPGSAGRRLDPSERAAAELAWVPLFVKEPGQVEGVVDDRNWQHVDLLPTLADYAGVAVPWRVDGLSARREVRTDPQKIYVEYEDVTDRRVLDDGLFTEILADPDRFPRLPPEPSAQLVGVPVAGRPVTAGPTGGRVDNLAAFADVRPADGTVPALVYGTVPEGTPVGAPLAIAVNGRVGAVVPVVAAADGGRRFAGLVADEELFRTGGNELELYLVTDGGAAWRHLPLTQ
jgi:hypothetical protein